MTTTYLPLRTTLLGLGLALVAGSALHSRRRHLRRRFRQKSGMTCAMAWMPSSIRVAIGAGITIVHITASAAVIADIACAGRGIADRMFV